MTTVNKLRLKRRVVASLPAALAAILLAYGFLGVLGPAGDTGGAGRQTAASSQMDGRAPERAFTPAEVAGLQ